ncbi:MAG: outer membrane beta-barrel protein [Bacteroidales bacterium]
MVNGDSNIDLLFRNGLRDMEVLPPSDAWDNISTVIPGRRVAGIFYRAVAGVAVLVSMGMLAWFTTSRGPEMMTEATMNQAEPLITLTEDPVQTLAVSDRSEADEVGDKTIELPPEAQLIPSTVAVITGPVVKPAIIAEITDVTSSKPALVLRRTGSGDIPREMAVAIPGYSEGTAPLSLVDIEMGEENKTNRWRVGAEVSPTYLSSNLRAASRNISEMVSNESATLSYSGGVAVSFSVGNRLALQTGIYYSSLGREISGIASYSGFSTIAGSKSGTVFGVETTTGRVNTNNRDIFLADMAGDRIQSIYTADNFDPLKADLTPFGTKLQQSYEYLEIPFMLSYRVIDRRIGLNITGGMSYNFLLDNKTYAVGENLKVPVGSTSDLSALLLSSALGMNLEYSFTDKIMVNMGPSVRYYLNSNGRLSADNPYTFGVWSGLFYKF